MTASDGAGPDREAHSRRGPWPTCDCLIHAGAHQSCWPPSMKCPCWRAPTPPADDPRQHCDRCHRPLPHTDAERAACQPADGVEVREEWGVRINREPLDLDELRRVAEAATPGEWRWDTEPTGDWGHQPPDLVSNNGEQVIGSWGHDADGVAVSNADMAYIAAMDPPTTLALLAEVVALREQVARVRAEVTSWHPGAIGEVYQGRVLAALDAAPKEPRP